MGPRGPPYEIRESTVTGGKRRKGRGKISRKETRKEDKRV